VAAGAVVTSHVAPYAVVAGNPARPVGRRFDGESIAAHERLLTHGGRR
jgi:virginiamycin A acetyltransferase